MGPIPILILGGVVFYLYEKDKNPAWSPFARLLATPADKVVALEKVKVTSVPTPSPTVALDPHMSTDQVKQVNTLLTTETDPKKIAAHAVAQSALGNENSALALAAKANAVGEAMATGASDVDLHKKQIEGVAAAAPPAGAVPIDSPMTPCEAQVLLNVLATRQGHLHVEGVPLPLPITNVLDAETAHLITIFQAEVHLPTSGMLDQETAKALRMEALGQGAAPHVVGYWDEFGRWRHHHHHHWHPPVVDEVVVPEVVGYWDEFGRWRHHHHHHWHPPVVEEVVVPEAAGWGPIATGWNGHEHGRGHEQFGRGHEQFGHGGRGHEQFGHGHPQFGRGREHEHFGRGREHEHFGRGRGMMPQQGFPGEMEEEMPPMHRRHHRRHLTPEQLAEQQQAEMMRHHHRRHHHRHPMQQPMQQPQPPMDQDDQSMEAQTPVGIPIGGGGAMAATALPGAAGTDAATDAGAQAGTEVAQGWWPAPGDEYSYFPQQGLQGGAYYPPHEPSGGSAYYPMQPTGDYGGYGYIGEGGLGGLGGYGSWGSFGGWGHGL